MTGTKVLVVDDHPLTAEGLSLASRAALLGGQVVTACSIVEAEYSLSGRLGWRLLILDYHLPDAHGFAGMLRLQQLAPAVPIVIVTGDEDHRLAEAAKALGAAGLLYKSLPLDTIASILRSILQGATYFPAEAVADQSIAAVRTRISTLSRAQYAVHLALADDRANKQIAYDLSIAEPTVKAHLTVIFRKLGVTNRSQALLAIRPLVQERQR